MGGWSLGQCLARRSSSGNGDTRLLSASVNRKKGRLDDKTAVLSKTIKLLGISGGSSCGTLLCFSDEHDCKRSESIFLWGRLGQTLTAIFMAAAAEKVTQSCLTLCDPMDYTVHGTLQARILERVAFSFSRGSSQGSNPGLTHCRQILYQLSP